MSANDISDFRTWSAFKNWKNPNFNFSEDREQKFSRTLEGCPKINGRPFAEFIRFVLNHAHEVEHGLYSYGLVIEMGDHETELLEFVAKDVAEMFNIPMDVAESACMNWFLHVTSKMRPETFRRMSGFACSSDVRKQSIEQLKELKRAESTNAPEVELMRQFWREAFQTKPPTSPPTSAKTKPSKPERKKKKMAAPVVQVATAPQKPANPAAEWTAVEMQSAAQCERPEEWETILNVVDAIRARNSASVSMLQNGLGFTYKKSVRIIGKLEKLGVVGKSDGVNARAILKLPAT